MKKIIIVFVALFMCCSCSNEKTLKTFSDIQEEGNYIIVDVRTKEEFDEEHVVGAINIPYDEIDGANLDKDKTIVVYCKSGKRSRVAYESLIDNGYDAFDLGSYDTINLDKE